MQNTFQEILNLLVSPQGNLIFHLTLAFSIIASLQAALINRQKSTTPHANRLILGLGMLLLGQVILFFSSGLAWQNILDERVLIPPLDRAVMLFSLIWIVWLWNFPAPARLGDVVTGFLNLGVVALFLFTYTSWGLESTSTYFNNVWIDQVWVLSTAVLTITGIIILIFSRPPGWGFGLGMLGLILAGAAGHYFLAPANLDLSPYLRLGQLAAFPLLPTLMHRFSLLTAPARGQQAAIQPAGQAQVPFPRNQERRRYSADPRTVQAWLELGNASEPEKVLTGMAKAIAHTMLSDLCFILSGQSFGHIVLQAGYDLIREEAIPGTVLEQQQAPALSNAIQRGKPLCLRTEESTPADLRAISDVLGLREVGSLLFIPIFHDEKPQGGLLLLSPYSNRQWTTDDQSFLATATESIAQILSRAQEQPSAQIKTEAGEDIRAELEFQRQENRLLLEEISELRSAHPENGKPASQTDIDALVALQQETQAQILQLQSENERLQAALRERAAAGVSPESSSQLEAELRATLQEIAMLQNELAEANARYMLLEREARMAGRSTGEDREVVASIVQEIRQPMSSILGYTDLLLAESVGILGALQRKFLERIKASTEKMRTILDDLIQVTVMIDGPVELLPVPIELGPIIDGAIADTTAQLREKNIALLVDLPQDLPQILADRDALQQIIVHLLQNAGAVTPPENTITLRTRVEKENDKDYLLLQITDTGGGVRTEDLPRVFARRYRADKPLIQGLGDTGVGLSIAKTLVEAHGGRIWVDSIAGQGTTFSVLLPIHPNSVDVKAG